MTFRARATSLALTVSMLSACSGDDGPFADQPELHDIDKRSPRVVLDAEQAIVRIQHPIGASGTGSFISADGLLLTNYHVLGGEMCAREGCQINLSFQHQKGVTDLPARAVWAVPQHADVGVDMTAVQIFLDQAKTQRLDTPNFLGFETKTSAELIGTHVTVVGHPLGRLKKWTDGVVIGMDGEWIDTTAFSLPGSSGSPFLNDAGKIVGLLHRGVEGFDLLTETSTQVTAIGSASADVQRALAAPLPATVISLTDSLTQDEALAYNAVFLAASTWTANVEGLPTTFVSMMASECDAGLARNDFDSLEEMQAAIGPCFSAMNFIECRSDVRAQSKTTPKECPQDRSVWLTRLQAAATKEEQFNGSLDLSAVSYSGEVLADNQDAGEAVGRMNLLAMLDRAKPTLNFSIGNYLASYGVASWNNQDVVKFFTDYKKQKFYARDGYTIASSAFWLYSYNEIKKDQALQIAKTLYRDDTISIGSQLRIEELLYNSGEL